MAWLEGCVGCGKTKTTLRKIENGPRICKIENGPRICNDCREKLLRTRQLTVSGGKGKMILKGNEITFVPMVKGGTTDGDVNRSQDASPQGGSNLEQLLGEKAGD